MVPLDPSVTLTNNWTGKRSCFFMCCGDKEHNSHQNLPASSKLKGETRTAGRPEHSSEGSPKFGLLRYLNTVFALICCVMGAGKSADGSWGGI